MTQQKIALIVMDMQADYIGKKSKYPYYPDTLIKKINDRITSSAKDKEIIIYVKNIGKRNKEPYISDFAEELSILSNHIVEKGKSSVSDHPVLLELLKSNGITKLEMIGIDGNSCIAASAIDAAKSGFTVVLPMTYIGIKNKEHFIKTRERLLRANVQIILPQEEG